MSADVLTTTVADGIAVITLGSARRIYFDEEMGDALTEALDGFAGDANVRVTAEHHLAVALYWQLEIVLNGHIHEAHSGGGPTDRAYRQQPAAPARA